ncbi:MAG: hypothetical protein ACR2H3_07310 [Acidimicrobiales bacterium]
MAKVLHGVRLFVAAVGGGVVAGGVAGFGSRLIMFVIRQMNPSFNGQITHESAEVGRWTLAGTLGLVVEGMFLGVTGGLVYLVVRRWMPGRHLVKGLSFGVFLVVVGGRSVIDANYEYYRYVSTWVSVSLFASLFLLFGLVLSPLVEWSGRGVAGPPRSRVVRWVGSVAVGALVVWSVIGDIRTLDSTFRVFG